jgi:DNA-binding transcriptional regulator YbjK
MSHMDELIESILTVLAEIRAEPAQDLVSEVEAAGMDAVMVTSQEVVAILVTLEAVTGIDASDPEVLKGCNLQSLERLTAFVAAAAADR